jgi:hypothetical protein
MQIACPVLLPFGKFIRMINLNKLKNNNREKLRPDI